MQFASPARRSCILSPQLCVRRDLEEGRHLPQLSSSHIWFRGCSGCLGETTALILSEPSFKFALYPHLGLDLGSKAAHFSVSAFVGYAYMYQPGPLLTLAGSRLTFGLWSAMPSHYGDEGQARLGAKSRRSIQTDHYPFSPGHHEEGWRGLGVLQIFRISI